MNMNIQKVKAVKNLVRTETGADVDSRSKTDELVKARAMCYKILRDECYMTYSYIANSFNKNHATIIHALREFEWMLKSDKGMERIFISVINKWRQQKGDYEELNPYDLKKQLNNLAEQNKLLNLSLINVQEKCDALQNHASKYDNIIESIEEHKLTDERFESLQKKLKHLLNGL